jgi:biopolymer transport protein ExbB
MVGRTLTGTLVLAIGVLSLLVSVPAAAWWNDDWGYRKPISIDTTPAGADLTNAVPEAAVLVRLHLGNFAYFTDTLPKGEDLRFVAADDVTPLAFHIESYDPSAQMAFIWVKLPDVLPAAKTQSFYMYYGNPNAPAGGDPAATYDKHQALVLNFAADPATIRDQTAYANNPTQVTAKPAAASLIGYGASFDGTGSIRLPASSSLQMDPAKGWTFSAWLRLESAQANVPLLDLNDPAGGRFQIGINDRALYVSRGSAGATPAQLTAATPLELATWHHVAVVADAAMTRIYVDGNNVAEEQVPLPALRGELTIGAAADGATALTGVILDEVEIANVARGVDAVKFAARSQGMVSTVLGYGEDAAREAGESESYFLTTLRNVTVDGWAVIGLLGLMALASWYVMVTKGLVIQRIRKDNAAFTKAFYAKELADLYHEPTPEEEELEESPLAQAMSSDHSHFRSSSLYHLYMAGMRDVQGRFAGTVGAARVRLLPSESINVIRASLDAANVRELQKLNNQMVILTLAISGGPFLGLLGTVVGVMITFAAIAASGDVNVNAIAPGIAAALVATVAGLGVAIPALFGYNYLGSRIKEITADNRVFLDEFIASVAEEYGSQA